MNNKPNIVIPAIRNSTELKHEIMRLNALRAEQEQALRRDLKELMYALQPSTVIRRTVTNLKKDDGVKASALQAGISLGSGFLLDKLLLRKGYGIKNYLINKGLKSLVSFFTGSERGKKWLARAFQA